MTYTTWLLPTLLISLRTSARIVLCELRTRRAVPARPGVLHVVTAAVCVSRPAAKKLGPVFVNVTDDGLQLLHKNGSSVPLKDLTLAGEDLLRSQNSAYLPAIPSYVLRNCNTPHIPL